MNFSAPTRLWMGEVLWPEFNRCFLLLLQELYCKIVSQARVVGACIRNAEREIEEEKKNQLQSPSANEADQKQEQNSVETTTTDEQNLNSISSTSSSNQNQKHRSGPNLKGLEKRYHLLYLKAFEIQCMLESLLNKKESQVKGCFYFAFQTIAFGFWLIADKSIMYTSFVVLWDAFSGMLLQLFGFRANSSQSRTTIEWAHSERRSFCFTLFKSFCFGAFCLSTVIHY